MRQKALAAQPAWGAIWTNWSRVGAAGLPLAVLIWRESPRAIPARGLALVGAGIDRMVAAQGDVKRPGARAAQVFAT